MSSGRCGSALLLLGARHCLSAMAHPHTTGAGLTVRASRHLGGEFLRKYEYFGFITLGSRGRSIVCPRGLLYGALYGGGSWMSPRRRSDRRRSSADRDWEVPDPYLDWVPDDRE